MKKILSIMMLICIGLSAYAINYPTYKPDPRDRQMQPNRPTMQRQEAQVVGGYSTVATGGTTTTGEGSAVAGPARGPRRVNYGKDGENWLGERTTDGLPAGNGLTKGDVFTNAEGKKYQWFGGDDGWMPYPDDDPGNPQPVGDPGNPQPVGSPMVMLLFAAAACGAVYLRRRKAQA